MYAECAGVFAVNAVASWGHVVDLSCFTNL